MAGGRPSVFLAGVHRTPVGIPRDTDNKSSVFLGRIRGTRNKIKQRHFQAKGDFDLLRQFERISSSLLAAVGKEEKCLLQPFDTELHPAADMGICPLTFVCFFSHAISDRYE